MIALLKIPLLMFRVLTTLYAWLSELCTSGIQIGFLPSLGYSIQSRRDSLCSESTVSFSCFTMSAVASVWKALTAFVGLGLTIGVGYLIKSNLELRRKLQDVDNRNCNQPKSNEASRGGDRCSQKEYKDRGSDNSHDDSVQGDTKPTSEDRGPEKVVCFVPPRITSGGDSSPIRRRHKPEVKDQTSHRDSLLADIDAASMCSSTTNRLSMMGLSLTDSGIYDYIHPSQNAADSSDNDLAVPKPCCFEASVQTDELPADETDRSRAGAKRKANVRQFERSAQTTRCQLQAAIVQAGSSAFGLTNEASQTGCVFPEVETQETQTANVRSPVKSVCCQTAEVKDSKSKKPDTKKSTADQTCQTVNAPSGSTSSEPNKATMDTKSSLSQRKTTTQTVSSPVSQKSPLSRSDPTLPSPHYTSGTQTDIKLMLDFLELHCRSRQAETASQTDDLLSPATSASTDVSMSPPPSPLGTSDLEMSILRAENSTLTERITELTDELNSNLQTEIPPFRSPSVSSLTRALRSASTSADDNRNSSMGEHIEVLKELYTFSEISTAECLEKLLHQVSVTCDHSADVQEIIGEIRKLVKDKQNDNAFLQYLQEIEES